MSGQIEWGEGRAGLQASSWRADAQSVEERGEKGESLTSGGVRKGGGVSERTLIRPLGHTR